MKPASQITDRAKRYRAQQNRPPGPKRCNICSSRKNVDIDHISGDEADGDPVNLWNLCRSCNARKAVQQSRNRIGVRTRQYNGRRPSFKQYGNAALVLIGLKPGDVGEATEIVRATAPADRVEYGEMMRTNPLPPQLFEYAAQAAYGQVYGKKKRNPPTFAQYARGVAIHQRGTHDEGGAIIHATPPALRSKYARQIAAVKRQRGTAGRSSVPF